MASGVVHHARRQRGAAFPMDFDLVLRDVRLADAKPDQPATDIGVKDGRIAAIAPQLGGSAKEQVQGGGRLVCSGFVETHIHLDKSCILARCDMRDQALSASRHGAGLGRQAQLHGRGRHRARSGHDREVHRPRRHPHAHPCRGRSQGRAARARRRQGADRPLPLGDRPRNLRHAAGGPDQQSRHRRADGRSPQGGRHRGRCSAQLRHRPARPDPPRLRDGARIRRRHRHASRQRRLGRGARYPAGLRSHREVRLGRARRHRARLQARLHAPAGHGQGGAPAGRCRRGPHGADGDRPLSRRPPHRPQRAAQRGRPQPAGRARRGLLRRLQQHPQSLHAVRRRPAAAPGQHAGDRHPARQRRRGARHLGHDHDPGGEADAPEGLRRCRRRARGPGDAGRARSRHGAREPSRRCWPPSSAAGGP